MGWLCCFAGEGGELATLLCIYTQFFCACHCLNVCWRACCAGCCLASLYDVLLPCCHRHHQPLSGWPLTMAHVSAIQSTLTTSLQPASQPATVPKNILASAERRIADWVQHAQAVIAAYTSPRQPSVSLAHATLRCWVPLQLPPHLPAPPARPPAPCLALAQPGW